MKKEIIRSKRIGGTYSTTTVHATRAGGFVFVTGQVANKPGSQPTKEPHKVVELGSIEEQTVQVLENMKAILEDAGTSFEHIVKRNTYLCHMTDFDIVYKTFERYFTSGVASTTILANLVVPSARLEIECIAVVPD